jgi:predicted pyridoxine 5'-phosphate oxidase superfamily flavin-nucleotide-binding protein
LVDHQDNEAKMRSPSSDIAFTPTIKAIQARRGSRSAYAKLEARGGFQTELTEELVHFLAQVDTAFLATASAEGQPYVQHRGGPKGFIHVIGARTLGFADFVGNRQYVTTGNLMENDKAFLFLMDFAHRRRVKIWGRARAVEDDPDLVARLTPEGYPARPQQAIVFEVDAWDVNCPRHIHQKLDAAEVTEAFVRMERRIASLEGENERLRGSFGKGADPVGAAR